MAECKHAFVFLRQETRNEGYPRNPNWVVYDVFFCSKCLTRQQVKQSITLRTLLDTDIERHALIIDELEAKRTALSATLSTQQLNDHDVQSAMLLIERIQSAAGRIRTITDFAVKRELLQALDIRATTGLDTHGAKILDIHWCLMHYRVPLNKLTAGGVIDNTNHVLTWRVALREKCL